MSVRPLHHPADLRELEELFDRCRTADGHDPLSEHKYRSLESVSPSGDGFVGIADLNEILGNWNAGTPPAAEDRDTIPAPGSAALVLVGAAALLRGGRSRT